MRKFSPKEFFSWAESMVGTDDRYFIDEEDGDVLMTTREGGVMSVSFCFVCRTKFRKNATVHYDEINRMAYCGKCSKEINPRHEAGADQSSNESLRSLSWLG